MKKEIDVYDTPSNVGGTFTVSIVKDLGQDLVTVRVWYGRPTEKGWKAWREWDGYRFNVNRARLTNPRKMTIKL